MSALVAAVYREQMSFASLSFCVSYLADIDTSQAACRVSRVPLYQIVRSVARERTTYLVKASSAGRPYPVQRTASFSPMKR